MPRSRVGYLISCVHNSDIKLMRHQVRDQTTYGAWGFLSIPVPSEIGARQTRALVTRYPKFSTQNALHGSRLLRGVVLDFPRFSCSTIVGSVPLPVHMKRLKKEKKKKRLESSGYHNSRNVYMVWLPPFTLLRIIFPFISALVHLEGDIDIFQRRFHSSGAFPFSASYNRP